VLAPVASAAAIDTHKLAVINTTLGLENVTLPQILSCLSQLEASARVVTLDMLRQTKIGVSVNGVRKHVALTAMAASGDAKLMKSASDIDARAKQLVACWKKLVPAKK
jgi:hypothetical protein